MSLRIPLPNAPAGSVIEGAGQINALTGQNLNNQIKRVQAQYAPITVPAKAASELTYSSLMGPQFLAKAFNNPDFLANLSDPQKRSVVDLINKSGQGQSALSGIFSNLPIQSSSSTNPLLRLVMGGLNKIFGQQQSASVPQQNNQQISGLSNEGQQAVSKLKPRQSHTVPSSIQQPVDNQPTFAENVGTYQGIKEQGKESGRIRAKSYNDLDDIAFNGKTMQGTLDQLSGIVNSPEFREIRQIPIAGQHEIGWYSKFGTPAQKYMIGRFLSEQGQIVVNAASQFKGSFRVGEQGLINSMKVNSSDMPEVASGKIQGMSLMNKMLTQRASLTARLMEDQHLSKGKASEIADKQINGDEIRNQLDNAIMISIRNKKTGERKTIPLSEARKLGVPNV